MKVEIKSKGATHTLLTSRKEQEVDFQIAEEKLVIQADNFDQVGAEMMENVLIIKPDRYDKKL